MRVARYSSFALLAAMLSAAPALAQPADNFPSKPVTLITPAAAGNSPDVAARIVADRLTQLWKQQVLILNRPGAGGVIAAQAASSVERDGYTLYMTQASTYTVLPVMQTLPFDLDKAFVPIGLVGEQPIAVAVTPSLPVSTLPELMELARKTPNGLLYGATNRGGQSHLTGELLRTRADLPLTFVHASGAAASINDVSTGRIPVMFEAIAGLAGAIQGKLVKPLAVASAQRLPNFPDLPTFAETLPGFESKGWLALMAPAGTPEPIIARISADLAVVLAQPEVRDKLATLGTYVRPLSPQQTAAFIKQEQALWWPVVRAVNEGK